MDFILFHFFNEIIKNVFFMASYVLFWKKIGDVIIKNKKIKKKIEKCSQNVIIFSSNLNRIFDLENVEIWISLFP